MSTTSIPTVRCSISNSKGATDLLPALDQPQKKDLGRNGTYLVIRQLVQDVRGFWQFADKAAESNPEERKRLAEAMVGRAMNGSPLVPLQNQPIDGVGQEEKDRAYNQFTYDTDPVRRSLSTRIAHSSRQSSQCGFSKSCEGTDLSSAPDARLWPQRSS